MSSGLGVEVRRPDIDDLERLSPFERRRETLRQTRGVAEPRIHPPLQHFAGHPHQARLNDAWRPKTGRTEPYSRNHRQMDKAAKKENELSLDEKLKAVMEKIAKFKGKPEAAEKMPKLLEREKNLRARMAAKGEKKA